MGEESLFLKYIRATLKKWVGFQVAIDEGMGGLYAREKEIWLGSEIEKYFKTYNDVKPDELEEYVGTMIDNEFDILIEDGSLLDICKLFCRAHNMPEDAPIFQTLKRIPAGSSAASNSSQSGEANTASKTDAAADNIEIQEDNVATQLTALEIKESDEQPLEDEGWTVVNRKHNKHTHQINRSTTSN